MPAKFAPLDRDLTSKNWAVADESLGKEKETRICSMERSTRRSRSSRSCAGSAKSSSRRCSRAAHLFRGAARVHRRHGPRPRRRSPPHRRFTRGGIFPPAPPPPPPRTAESAAAARARFRPTPLLLGAPPPRSRLRPRLASMSRGICARQSEHPAPSPARTRSPPIQQCAGPRCGPGRQA
jgi:hypothetical protein